MTTRFEIREAKAYHCGQVARRLRTSHVTALLATDARMGVHREMRRCFDASCYARSWFIDGEIAAIGGVIATVASPNGFVWLALTQEAGRHRVAMVKEARRQLAEVMRSKRELATTILSEDIEGQRFAAFLGFHVADDGNGERAFSRHGRKTLLQHLSEEGPHRLPVGGGFVVAMGYHEEDDD